MNTNKLYLAIFLLILLNNFTISESIAIISIPDANLNATSALAFLNNFEKENYLYFSFDFNYHNQVPQKEKNTAYFKLTSELFFSYSDFKIYFLDKKQEEVTSSDIDTKNYMIWEPCYLISKEKVNNEYDYYIQIKRFDLRNRKNTVILRVPIYKKEGQITVENLYSLPENILEKKNKFNNFNSWPKKDQYHSDRNNNNQNMYSDYYKNHYRHYKHHHGDRIFGNALLCILGMALLEIWTVILVLYCMINRRKRKQLAIIVGNSSINNNNNNNN